MEESKKRKINEITKNNDKEFLKDGLSSNDIRKTINYIREYIMKGGNLSLEDRINKLKLEHKFFVERYPMLFEMSVQKEFNYDNLNFFLNMRDKVINDNISSEDASKKIGQIWFDKYVDVSSLEKKVNDVR